jgi:hypothetical protein
MLGLIYACRSRYDARQLKQGDTQSADTFLNSDGSRSIGGFCFAPGSFRSSPGDRRGPLQQPIKRAQLRAVPGDAAAAVSWYRRARELGVTEAEILLQGIQTR